MSLAWLFLSGQCEYGEGIVENGPGGGGGKERNEGKERKKRRTVLWDENGISNKRLN